MRGVAFMRMALVVAVLAGVAALAAGCADPDVKSAYYSTYADAISDGAQARGWLPSFVPASATELYEQHDLDTSEQWLRFQVPAAEDSFTGGMRQITREEVPIYRYRPPGTDWWFGQDRRLDEGTGTYYEAGQCSEEPPGLTREGYLLVQGAGAGTGADMPSDNLVYYWCM